MPSAEFSHPADVASPPAPERPVLVVLHGAVEPAGLDELARTAEVRLSPADGLASALPGADALFVYDFLSAAVRGAWPAADRLRWVHMAAAGVDPVLFPGLVESDVVLTNSRGVFDTAIAEYVLGVLLAFAKDLPASIRLQDEKRWQHRETRVLGGGRALVVGVGPIGRAIARLLRAVGMRVSGVASRARESDPDFDAVYAGSELVEQLPAADAVVAVAPLTERTRHMFDATAFAAMRPSATFVNVGRGELVVTADLVRALESGAIARAALDVFDIEPLPAESPLWTMDSVLVSPHMSGDFVGWRDTLVRLFLDNFTRWTAGEPLRNVVDKHLGYVPSEH